MPRLESWRRSQGREKQEDEERGDGMFLECGGEEEFIFLIQIWEEERYKFFLACIF